MQRYYTDRDGEATESRYVHSALSATLRGGADDDRRSSKPQVLVLRH